MPHLDKILASFGARHDVSRIQAHVGGPAAEAAAAIGAQAYATGGHVAFASQPDLRTAAHEAAHVVQQRRGVQLAGALGAEGDVYERNADAVAEAVTRGRSAEALLDALPMAASQARGVQRIKLSGLKLTGVPEVKQFKTSEAVSHPYYIFIASKAKVGWHITIPVTRNLTAKEVLDYDFTSYHVTEEGSDNAHYHYDRNHKQDHTDYVTGAPKWATADAVVEEIFGVKPKPMYGWTMRYRLKLVEERKFAEVQKFLKALAATAKHLAITEKDVTDSLDNDEVRPKMWPFVQDQLGKL